MVIEETKINKALFLPWRSLKQCLKTLLSSHENLYLPKLRDPSYTKRTKYYFGLRSGWTTKLYLIYCPWDMLLTWLWTELTWWCTWAIWQRDCFRNQQHFLQVSQRIKQLMVSEPWMESQGNMFYKYHYKYWNLFGIFLLPFAALLWALGKSGFERKTSVFKFFPYLSNFSSPWEFAQVLHVFPGIWAYSDIFCINF